MHPKPDHLGPEYGEQFSDPSVVEAYHYRPHYPPEIFDLLSGLVVAPDIVLDIGAGTGEIARGLAERGLTVDAVDPSPGMLARGKQMPGGDSTCLTWILGRAEDAPLRPAYGLIVAASSLHWTDWPVTLPRFRDLLAPSAVLAIVERRAQPNAWDSALQEQINRYSTNRRFRPYDLVEELVSRNLFQVLGRQRTPERPFRQPLSAYVESFHSRNGFSRDRMGAAAAAAFDQAVTELVAPHVADGEITVTLGAEVIWGTPAPL